MPKKHDLQGNQLKAIFTRIRADLFARLQGDADEEKRSVSQQAALILERHYDLRATRQKGKQP